MANTNMVKTKYPELAAALEAAGFKYGKSCYYKIDSGVSLNADFNYVNRFYIGFDDSDECVYLRAKRKGEKSALDCVARYMLKESQDKAYAKACKRPTKENIKALVKLLENKGE